MIIHWAYLLGGILLACFPGKYFRGSDYRLFEYEQISRRFSDKNRRRRRWWKMPAVWIEPVRGFAAAFVLTRAFSLEPEIVEKSAQIAVLLLPMFILSVGVTLQCHCQRDRTRLLSPAGFLIGVLVCWLPPEVSVPAVVLGASSASAFRRWEAGHFFGSLATVIIGYFFMGRAVSLVWAGGIYLWPVVLAWFLRRKLTIAIRM